MIRKGIKQLIAEAETRTQGISVEQARARLGDANTVFIDILDVRELEREGMIPGAFHTPRGVMHMAGGFGEWRKAGTPTVPRPQRQEQKKSS